MMTPSSTGRLDGSGHHQAAIHIAPVSTTFDGGIHVMLKIVSMATGYHPGFLPRVKLLVACGNNRVGGNSIAETIVFGRQAGQQVTSTPAASSRLEI